MGSLVVSPGPYSSLEYANYIQARLLERLSADSSSLCISGAPHRRLVRPNDMTGDRSWPQPVLLKQIEEGPLQVRVWNPKVRIQLAPQFGIFTLHSCTPQIGHIECPSLRPLILRCVLLIMLQPRRK